MMKISEKQFPSNIVFLLVTKLSQNLCITIKNINKNGLGIENHRISMSACILRNEH